MPKVMRHGSGTAAADGRRGARACRPSLAEINVIPLVDVMLVLLIIFMVAAPMMQQGIEVNLPGAARRRAAATSAIYVTVPAVFGKRSRVQIDKEESALDVLTERMRQAMPAARRKAGVPARRRRGDHAATSWTCSTG